MLSPIIISFHFQLEEIWSRNYGYFSIGLTKNLPYRKIMEQSVKDLREKGHLQRTLLKWKTKERSCPSEEFHDLGIPKLAFLFTIIIIGFTISFSMLIYELLHSSQKIHQSDEQSSKEDFRNEMKNLLDAIEREYEIIDNPQTLLDDLKSIKEKLV